MNMSVQETMERYFEGLKKAASRARELGRIQKNHQWSNVAAQLDILLKRGKQLYEDKPLSRQEALNIIDQRVKH